ncbi:cytochrome-c peroxidase [Chitinophaga sp. 30R24]|uniref:cytochrome-c peroxidase n=1 Tax=Chitinophaga sp. 30R24 TaxID=3248838 RepID=UPI003B909498
MKRTAIIIFSLLVVMITSALTIKTDNGQKQQYADSLRQLYARPVALWPKPFIDSGVQYQEFAALPSDTGIPRLLQEPAVILGKTLFFDPRLSSSNQISCSSCHDPDLAWGDGRTVSLGNDHLQGTRNTMSLLNVAIRNRFFWDGRVSSLEDQVMHPIAMHHEMNMDPVALPAKLQKIKGYQELFKRAFGDGKIDQQKISSAIATFERAILSRTSRFDLFISGGYNRLTDEEIQGLHLFRTKARCMNCHNGQYFTDNQFHNIGLTYYQRTYEDLGRYNVTKRAADVGKFRTPSLRDVMLTRPWMHNGLFDNIDGVINIYNSGMQMMKPKPGQENDTLFPRTDPLMQKLDLTVEEKKAVVAFLHAITGVPYKMRRPELPQ